jgi:hypothetical protein
MSDNVLIPLPGFTLPTDYPWQVRFISAVERHLRRLRASGRFLPPRFFGYFFQGGLPMAVSGNWTVTLDKAWPISDLPSRVYRLTNGEFQIESGARDRTPEFLLVHDRRDGSCWLWQFTYGLRFVEATEPIGESADPTVDGSQDQRLLGP